MTRQFRFGLMVAIGAMITCVASNGASAAVIYGDIAGNSVGSGYGVGPTGSLNNAIAEGFTMTQSYNLASVDLILSDFTVQAGSNLALSLYSDNAGSPGTDLYDLSTNVVGTISNTPTTASFAGTGSFLLTAGTTYWLDLYATNPASTTGNNVLWGGEFSGGGFAIPTGVGATEMGQERSVGGGNPPIGPPRTNELRTAFQLNGSPVPEPPSICLAVFASAILLVVHGKLGRQKTSGDIGGLETMRRRP